MNVRELHTVTPEALLHALEQRQEAYASAKAGAEMAAQSLKSLYALSYTARRSQSGSGSVEDVKQSVIGSDTYKEASLAVIEAERNAEAAKGALERVRVAIELWRSQRADLRKI